MKKLLLFVFFVPCVTFSQGKLKKVKENLNKKASSTKSGKRVVRQTTSSSSEENNNIEFPFFLAELTFYATLGVAFGQAQERDLNPYPYFYDNEGEYAAELSDTGRKQSIKLGANYLFNVVKSLELNALYKPIPIVGIEASHIHFSEKNRISKEFLDITSFTVNYHRIRQKNISLWWGVGATHVGNGVNSLGFAYTLGTEIYPVKPVSLHISWKQSFVNGNDVDLFKAQLKYHIKNKAAYIGYRNYSIAGENISGPTIGFEITF